MQGGSGLIGFRNAAFRACAKNTHTHLLLLVLDASASWLRLLRKFPLRACDEFCMADVGQSCRHTCRPQCSYAKRLDTCGTRLLTIPHADDVGVLQRRGAFDESHAKPVTVRGISTTPASAPELPALITISREDSLSGLRE